MFYTIIIMETRTVCFVSETKEPHRRPQTIFCFSDIAKVLHLQNLVMRLTRNYVLKLFHRILYATNNTTYLLKLFESYAQKIPPHAQKHFLLHTKRLNKIG